MDLGTGGLDIALGKEDEISTTLIDLLTGVVSTERALLPGDDGVYFLSAPVFFNDNCLDNVSQEGFNALLSYFKETFDFILFDMPAGGGAAFPFLEASSLVDLTLLVTTPAPTAVRAAERCAMRMKNPEKLKLILNSYRISRPNENASGVVEVIQKTSVPILGVIPFDSLAEKALVRGVPLTGMKKSVGGIAISNITDRILEESVPLFCGILSKKKRFRFY